MKILITGGFGYIGGRLVSYLKETQPDCEIIIATRNPTRFPLWARRIQRIPLELSDPLSIEKCVRAIFPECIIHLAALSERDCASNPASAEKINHIGTKILYQNALQSHVKRFIYFSTFHVYGNAARGPITEKTAPDPIHPYAVTHFKAEQYILQNTNPKMHRLVFRLSNSYGYPVDHRVPCWTLLVNDLCRQAVTTKEIKLLSSGFQKRDFIPLSDVAEAVRYFLFDIPEDWGDGLYHLGSGQVISVYEMACQIAAWYQKKYHTTIQVIKKNDHREKNKNIFDFDFLIKKIKSRGFVLQNCAEQEVYQTMAVCEKFLT